MANRGAANQDETTVDGVTSEARVARGARVAAKASYLRAVLRDQAVFPDRVALPGPQARRARGFPVVLVRLAFPVVLEIPMVLVAPAFPAGRVEETDRSVPAAGRGLAG